LAAHRAELGNSVVKTAEAAESFAALGKKMGEQLPEIMRQTGSSVRALQNMAEEVGRTSASIDAALDGNRSGIERFTGQTLGEAGLLVSELRQLTATLQAVARELEQEPSALIFGRPRPAPGPGE
jgi:phospholipid/cholesterol/gamma-HCH transport system substrate-binding protein